MRTSDYTAIVHGSVRRRAAGLALVHCVARRCRLRRARVARLTRRPHRHSSSRARRPWRRRSRPTPTVKLSLEQVALLEGRITEARADALPDVSWSTRALRSRDPGLLNSPNFDQFPEEFRTALSPIPGNSFDTYADVKQTLFSFKLGNALRAARLARTAGDEDVRRARQATALLAIQGYNQLLFAIEQLRVARQHHRSETGPRGRGEKPPRRGRGDRARGSSRRGRPGEPARGAAAGGNAGGGRAGAAEHGDVPADGDAD